MRSGKTCTRATVTTTGAGSGEGTVAVTLDDVRSLIGDDYEEKTRNVILSGLDETSDESLTAQVVSLVSELQERCPGHTSFGEEKGQRTAQAG